MGITQAATGWRVAWGTRAMSVGGMTKRELFAELTMLRRQIVKLEAAEPEYKRELAVLRLSNMRLQIVHDLARAGWKELSTEAIARVAFESIGRLAPCQRIRIALFDFQTRRARVWTQDAQGITWSCSESPDHLSGESVSQGEGTSHGLGAKVVQTIADEGIRLCLSVPLAVHDVTIGVLNLWSSLSTGVAPEHIEIIHQVASALATVLYQANQRESLA